MEVQELKSAYNKLQNLAAVYDPSISQIPKEWQEIFDEFEIEEDPDNPFARGDKILQLLDWYTDQLDKENYNWRLH